MTPINFPNKLLNHLLDFLLIYIKKFDLIRDTSLLYYFFIKNKYPLQNVILHNNRGKQKLITFQSIRELYLINFTEILRL